MTQDIGLIGLGLAGRAIATSLIRAGFSVHGYDTAPEALRAAATLGVATVDVAGDILDRTAVIVLSLPDSDVVTEVLWGQGGIGDLLPEGALILDTTTGRPSDAQSNNGRLARHEVRYVDVTLSGSSDQIAAGTVTALIGDAEQSADYRRIVSAFASELFFLGNPGDGCLAKLVTNHVMGLNRAALAEGLALGIKAGMDPEPLLQVLRSSAAYSRVIDIKGSRMVRGEFDPASRIRQHAKDVGLIVQLAEQVGAKTPLERVHEDLLRSAMDYGWGDLDNAAIIKVYIDEAPDDTD